MTRKTLVYIAIGVATICAVGLAIEGNPMRNTFAESCAASGPNVDLHGCNFIGVNLSGADLNGANLANAVLLNANLNGITNSS